MTNQAILLKHYRKYPSKVLRAVDRPLALAHRTRGTLTPAELSELRAFTDHTAAIQMSSNDANEPNENDASSNEESDSTRQCWLKIATSDVDRAGDTLALDGVDLTNFMKNPQLLWMHGLTSLPLHTIGRILKVVSQNNALYALAEYPPADVYPFADQIYQLDLAGYLSANSIGFHPIEWEKNESGGFHFLKWELIECSKVELPMNPNAIDDALPIGAADAETVHESRAISTDYYTPTEAAAWLNRG